MDLARAEALGDRERQHQRRERDQHVEHPHDHGPASRRRTRRARRARRRSRRPMAVTASATSSDARPPYSSRDTIVVADRVGAEQVARPRTRQVGVQDGAAGRLGHQDRSGPGSRQEQDHDERDGIQMPAERLASAWLRRRTGSGGGAGRAPGCAPSGAAMAHPGVQHGIEQVGDEVRQHDDDGEDEHDALDHRDVAVGDRLQQSSRPMPGSPKICSMITVRPMSVPRFSADDRDQAEQRVAQRVPREDPPRPDALGPRGGDVVLAPASARGCRRAGAACRSRTGGSRSRSPAARASEVVAGCRRRSARSRSPAAPPAGRRTPSTSTSAST